MPARADVTLTDGEASPANHVFTPDGDVTEGVAAYINRNASVPTASERLTISVTNSSAPLGEIQEPGKKVSPRKVVVKLMYPATYTDAVSGLTKVDFVDEMIITSLIHPRSSEQRGENLRKMLAAWVGGSGTVMAKVHDLGERIW